ncbi:sugar phosphate nucleotidyltransferase [Vulcanisaeta distributa]|uniref:Nucleotidyl transferase n=1 Tax=Vulcanisaeta distributa (strain DSM 14429 / JCM 11212 / NBRC 100878 / IC-017) TaxID=572478 RepID=E1QV07_VULDI|nr:NDP-sugar synthase [Vulcanisaeta distributa]ADN51198.1 Nucleotidyl transferase [Vulcanisaeta distributa DSM 14429]
MAHYREVLGVILGGGRGTNMEPLTPYLDKPLIKLLGKPLIYYPTNNLVYLGLRTIYIISRDPAKVGNEVGRYFSNVSIENVGQRGDDIDSALKMIYEIAGRGTTIISFGDVILPREAYELALNSHVNSGKPVTVLMTPLSDLQGYFEVQVDDVVVINKVNEHKSGYAWTGILIAEREFLVSLHDFNGNINSTLMRFKGNVNVALWSGWFVDVSYPWDLLSAIKYLMSDLREARISKDADISSKAVIEGPVIVDEGARIDHGAIIRGPVYIGRNAYVGNNALIRNNTSLEEESVIGADAEITESLIGYRATVGRGSFIGSSVIGDESTIEPGVVTLNVLPSGVEVSHLSPVIVKGKQIAKLGAIVGPKARVGANSVIYPGSIIEHNRYIPPLSVLK